MKHGKGILFLFIDETVVKDEQENAYYKRWLQRADKNREVHSSKDWVMIVISTELLIAIGYSLKFFKKI